MPKNQIWGLDLTKFSAEDRPVLGIVDHGSRACLALERMESKRTVTILRHLLEVMELFGKPKAIRTDNEPMFRSVLWNSVLTVLGIGHQRTLVLAPWQNGRIERFFGSVKATWRQRKKEVHLGSVPDQQHLTLLRTWYNHLRPHQDLDGLTPAEAWRGKETNRQKEPVWLAAWDGTLGGYWWPPG